MEKEIIKKLSLSKNIELIGSNSLNTIIYKTDFDLQENIKIKTIKDYLKYVSKFQQMFTSFQKSDTIYITDFKSGYYKTKPVRWDYSDIMNGFKIIDDIVTINLVDTLQLQNNKIKIDLIALIKGQFVEFSCNYYFHKNEIDVADIYKSLLLDVNKYYHSKKFMKMLKRLLSYRLIRNESVDDIVNFLNSEAGKLYQFQHHLDIILFVIEENISFHHKSVDQAINKLIESLPNEYKKIASQRATWKNILHKINNAIHKDLNVLVMDFLN